MATEIHPLELRVALVVEDNTGLSGSKGSRTWKWANRTTEAFVVGVTIREDGGAPRGCACLLWRGLAAIDAYTTTSTFPASVHSD